MTVNELKYYASLLQKKYRQREKKFLVEGERLINESLSSDHLPERIFYTEDFFRRNEYFIQRLNELKVASEKIKSAEFQKISETKNPQGIGAIFSYFHSPFPVDSTSKVALENISDPGNTGTIIRTAEWFGAKDIILSNDSAELYNPKTFRATMGAAFHSNIIIPDDFYGTLELLKSSDYEILCADMEGESLYNFEKKKKFVLVLSNEANGPGKQLLKIADRKITIPKFGKTESLNVSAAAAILLSEFRRKSY